MKGRKITRGKRRRGGQCLEGFDVAPHLAIDSCRQAAHDLPQLFAAGLLFVVGHPPGGIATKQQQRHDGDRAECDQVMTQRPGLHWECQLRARKQSARDGKHTDRARQGQKLE